MTKNVVRFSERPPSMYEVPQEPEEEDFFEKYLRRFQDPPSFVEPCDFEELPRLPSFSTRDQDTIYPFAGSPQEDDEAAGADRQKDTIFPFADLDLPSPSMLQLPNGPLPFEESPRMEMEDLVPHESQSMMPDSEYGPAPPLDLLEQMKHREFQVKLPLPPQPAPPPLFSQSDVFQETPDLPMGISELLVQGPQETMYPQEAELTEHGNMVLEDENIPAPSWCGMWNMNCREGKCGAKKVDDQNCVRCRKPLESFMDHQCPKCKVWFCVKCVARYPLNWFRCKCGDMEANQEVIRNNMWKIKAYHSTYHAVKSLSRGLSSLSSWVPSWPCRNAETAQSLKDSTITQLQGGDMPPDLVVPGDRTRLPASFPRQEVPVPKRKKPYRPGRMPLPPPPPPPPHGPSELPHLLGRHSLAIPMNYYETDPFRTRLPGEMDEED